MLCFCYDSMISDHIGLPNLARWSAQPFTAEWRQFDQHYPRVVPLRLLLYLDLLSIPYRCRLFDADTEHAWYPIALGWFDFDFDYIAALTPAVRQSLIAGKIRLLFYYHEGDNPANIKQRLDHLCDHHHLARDRYRFISANSAAEHLDNFLYFCEHESFFWYVNRRQKSNAHMLTPRFHFTVLARTHKIWRASAISDLHRHGVLDHSLWSYGSADLDSQDAGEDPIECLSDPAWAAYRDNFLQGAPYNCDEFDSDQQNDHHRVNQSLYHDSFCHVVFETHFDADQSDGVFLTEKTFKPIKYGQPFVLVAPHHSLQQLRDRGYSVFDHCIDNSYDTISDNTQRWLAIRDTLLKLMKTDLVSWYALCQADIKHNQQLFEQRASEAVNMLIEKLTWNN